MSNRRNQTSKSTHRGVFTGSQSSAQQLQMELVASVSRSSGLEKDGDTLKDYRVQEKYRVFVQGKVDDVLALHPRRLTESEKDRTARVNAQENVLILFREAPVFFVKKFVFSDSTTGKLREGISSSQRTDGFALEVYETSLYFAVLFESPKQTTAIIHPLVPSMYRAAPQPHKNRLIIVLISLLHHLIAVYPSQGTFRQFFDTIPSEFLPKTSEAHAWITALARSIRTIDYASFSALTSPSRLSTFLDDKDDLSQALQSLSLNNDDKESLPRRSFFTLMHSLRAKFQATTWNVVRSAYREISCNDEHLTLEQWLEKESTHGHSRQKEGADGRWLIYKPR
ncbi:hypothetical protein H0H93_014611 [Arthromyces matolae]|nr:hypothetical protein H0H93_014611 [Arthromyces matolae]